MSSRTLRMFTVVALISAPALAAQNPPPPPQPGPAQQKLAFFAGRWTSAGEMKPGPMGPGGKVSGTDTCEWFQGGFHLVCRSEGTSPMGAMKSMGILGYDTDRQRYTFYGVDNTGMGSGDMAYGQVSGDTWTWEGETMMGGQSVKQRYVAKQVSPDSYTFEFSMSLAGGPWAVVMTGTETRVK